MNAGTESTPFVVCLGGRSPVGDILREEMEENVDVAVEASLEDLLEALEDAGGACVVIDERAVDGAAPAIIEDLDRRRSDLPVVCVVDDAAAAAEALDAGASDAVRHETGPNGEALLAARVRNAIDRDLGSRNVYETLIEYSMDVITVIDPDGSLLYASPSFERQLGYDPSTVLGSDALAYVHPDDCGRVEDAFLELRETDDHVVEELEFRYEHADGSYVWVESIGSNRQDVGVSGFVLTSRIVQERKERQRELELKHRAIDEAPIGITIADAADPDMPVVYANSGFEALTGYDETDLEDLTWSVLAGEETDEAVIAEFERAIEVEEPVSAEMLVYGKDGNPIWTRNSLAPVEDRDGDVTNFVGFQQDVTRRKEYEAALERRFDEFSQLLAKDLREPIDRAVTELVAARETGDEDSLEEAITWLRRADSMLEDISIVHSQSVPDPNTAKSTVPENENGW